MTGTGTDSGTGTGIETDTRIGTRCGKWTVKGTSNYMETLLRARTCTITITMDPEWYTNQNFVTSLSIKIIQEILLWKSIKFENIIMIFHIIYTHNMVEIQLYTSP